MQYGCIGAKLGHSYSREVHGALGNPDYELKELTAEQLTCFFRETPFLGINVTIPYKTAVMPYLDEISDTAKRIGSVNTIVRRDGKLFGTNTDYDGMTALLRRAQMDLSGKTVLILGTGGTSKTAQVVAQDSGAEKIFVVSRTPSAGQISYAESLQTNAQYIINTTPCGMFPNSEAMPIVPERFPNLQGVADAVYNPLRTALVCRAEQMGIAATGGLFMLVAQAVEAAKHFYGTEFSAVQTQEVYRRIRASKENIILYGMPSCGKSTVGRRIAERLGRPFFDSDDWIEARCKKSIPQIFKEQGEAEFRRIEKEVLLHLAQTVQGGVIATGGGAVLQTDAVRALRRGGFAVYLDRPLNRLQLGGDRPLSATAQDLEKLYDVRHPLYQAAVDVQVQNTDSVEQTAQCVIGRFTDR